MKAMFTLRFATEKDIPTIIRIAEETWPKTYGHILSDAQMEYMMNLMYHPEKLKNSIQTDGTFLIATDEKGNDVAFAGYEPYTDKGAQHTFKLQKLYCAPQNQQKGLGKFMLNAVMEDIQNRGAKQLILNVNRFNSALRFYLKMGFHIQCRLDIHVGENYYMNDYVMYKNLA